ncbi:MAG: hypothetical protein WDN45_06385 [Caulobacteraceae bacterium]
MTNKPPVLPGLGAAPAAFPPAFNVETLFASAVQAPRAGPRGRSRARLSAADDPGAQGPARAGPSGGAAAGAGPQRRGPAGARPEPGARPVAGRDADQQGQRPDRAGAVRRGAGRLRQGHRPAAQGRAGGRIRQSRRLSGEPEAARRRGGGLPEGHRAGRRHPRGLGQTSASRG